MFLYIVKTGYLKDDLMFQLINLYGIELSEEAKSLLKSGSYKKGDKIKYDDAMTVIGIDIETAEY